ncbi:MAG: hypothetical protein IJ767_03750 [Bacteroidaceae bacterium]|nr:hypothetical protein [Bacteroidaceae bacterium]
MKKIYKSPQTYCYVVMVQSLLAASQPGAARGTNLDGVETQEWNGSDAATKGSGWDNVWD